MILKLSNKENTYTFTVDDLNNGEKLYYKFQIPASDVVDGKYNMVLMDDDGNIITEEQVCMGYFNAETIQYNRGENVYINSPLNANLEDVRTITIDVPSYTIYPSEGYDAMKEVVVDAQPVYDNGYNQGSTDGYDSGYTVGDADGYNRGYNEGEIAQKAKLTGITITENGTYSREDGYNEITVDVPDLNGDYNEGYDAGKVDGYDSGYTAGIEYASENAEEIAAANAIDLVATEFGPYYTKYSDNIVNPNPVTGIYTDGETFHNLAKVNNNVYNTGIIPNENTKLEFWFEPDTEPYIFDYTRIILTNNNSATDSNFGLYLNGNSTDMCNGRIGEKAINFQLNKGKINHIILSVADGLILNGEQIGTFDSSPSFNVPLYINGTSFNTRVSADGGYGMIKITQDGITNVIIPTENGFKNITTDEMLEVVYNEGTYVYINNDTIILDNLIKSVDVQPKIDVGRYGIKFGQSTFAEVPDFYDFSNVVNYYYMFYNCTSLQTIPELNTSNVTTMEYMFNGCKSLQTIPAIDTSNVSNMKSMFYESPNFISIPPLNAGKISFDNYSGLFYFTTMNKLTDFGGLIGFKGNANNDYTFVRCPNLTYQSCINILNGLADVTELGGRTLKVHPNFLNLVGDEISIGTNKNWTITA